MPTAAKTKKGAVNWFVRCDRGWRKVRRGAIGDASLTTRTFGVAPRTRTHAF